MDKATQELVDAQRKERSMWHMYLDSTKEISHVAGEDVIGDVYAYLTFGGDVLRGCYHYDTGQTVEGRSESEKEATYELLHLDIIYNNQKEKEAKKRARKAKRTSQERVQCE